MATLDDEPHETEVAACSSMPLSSGEIRPYQSQSGKFGRSDSIFKCTDSKQNYKDQLESGTHNSTKGTE